MVPPQVMPPEILLSIFSLAVEDCGSSLERLQLGQNNSYGGWKEGSGHRESLKTKLALVNTCRLWNVMATPLLYEHMSIANNPLCIRVLKAFSSTGPSAKYRHMVKRLDYVCAEKLEEMGFKVLVGLCKLFRELTTLVASLVIYRGDEPSPLFNALSPSLKHLYLLPRTRAGEELLPLSKIVDFLDDHPQLTDISLQYRFPTTAEANNVDPAWNSKSWLSIRTLVLQDEGQASTIASYLPPTAFPNLQGLNASWYASGSSEHLQNILSTHTGRTLATLSFEIKMQDSSSGLSNLLQKLETLYPQVHEVHVTVTQYPHPALFDSILGEAPQVTTVGVHLPLSMVPVQSDREMREMHAAVALPWTKVFPKLNTIRLMESVDFASYRKYDEVTRVKLRVPVRSAKFPIRVEDLSGRFLAEFTAGTCSLVEL